MAKELTTKALFGIHKKSADLYMKRLRYLQETELRELQAKVDEAKVRNRKLNEQLRGVRSLHRQEKAKELLEQTVRGANEEEQTAVTASATERPVLKVITMTPRSKVEEPAAVAAPVTQEPLMPVDNELGSIEPLPQEEAIGLEETEFIDSEQFWGPINHYMEMDLAPVQQFLTGQSESRPSQQPSREPLAVSETAAGLAQEEPEEEPSAMQEEPQDESINPEIESIKRNYIVGKIAGESLADGNGRLIVAKDSVITEQVVKRAQREGKLAELIVNMRLPSSGD
mgnify:CR=1 FL=1